MCHFALPPTSMPPRHPVFRMTPDQIEAIVATWPAERQTDFRERQAIMEIDGNMCWATTVPRAFLDVTRDA
jgi:hypothetical protein